MKRDTYVNLYGESIDLGSLDAQERGLLNRLCRRARSHLACADFSTFAMNAMGAFYDGRGMNRERARRTPLFAIALDLGNRLGIAQGTIAPPSFSYRAQLERLVLQFPSRAAFCKAAGISRDMLSHVLAGRKDLSLESLASALERVGYRLQFTPANQKRTG